MRQVGGRWGDKGMKENETDKTRGEKKKILQFTMKKKNH